MKYRLTEMANLSPGISVTSIAPGKMRVRVIKIRDLGNGGIESGNLDTLMIAERQAERYFVRAGDVILANRGTLFKSAVVQDGVPKSVITSNLCLIRLNGDAILLPIVLHAYFESRAGHHQLSKISRASFGRFVLSPRDLEAMLIPVPPMEDQFKLSQLVTETRRYQDLAERAAQKRKEITGIIVEDIFHRAGGV